MQRLKIALVLDDSLDSTDGVQQYVLTVGRWLSGQGHEVHYLVGMTGRTDIPNIHSLSRNIRVNFNGNRLSVPLPASKRRLRRLLERERFDILHIQAPYSPLLAGRLLKQVPLTTGVVGSFHVLPYTRVVALANRLLAFLNRRTAKRFDVMLANTLPTKRFADKIYGFDSRVVPNPFPLSQFITKPDSKGALKIVFLGRLVPRKGARELLEAVAYINEHRLTDERFEVIIGGKGSQREDLGAFVHRRGLNDLVTFSGFVDETDKAGFLAQADIAVFPSAAGESFGISLLEALAASRGVVLGGDNPGYRSVLAPLSPNHLVHPSDTASFAAALVNWLDDKRARDTAGKAQKAYVRQFDIEVVGRQLEETYKGALRRRQNMR